jgi:phosphomevalonate kinase
MKKRRVLAISGKRFSGKDTFASMIAERAEGRVVTYAFAAESKRMFAEQNPSIDLARLISDREYKELNRPALTAFTVAALAADPLVFCRSVADRIEASHDAALVSDMRLRIEVEHFRSRFNLHLVRLARSDAARSASGWVHAADVDGHHTETELDDPSWWDEVVSNDGTLDELAKKAEMISAKLT